MNPRRDFLSALGLGTAAALTTGNAAAQSSAPANESGGTLPAYARRQNYRTLRQSSYDRTGGNHDFVSVDPGAAAEVLRSDGPGIITHVWFTIASPSQHHLKELVFRAYWDGNDKPSVETPIGDFFGLNLGEYFLYQSAFLNCSSVKAMNSYFAMPFKRSARMTVTNEGGKKVDALYFNIDYQLLPALPDDSLYFHAQYRQAIPEHAVRYASPEQERNVEGKDNYVFVDTRGAGHLMGVTMGVVQNADGWFGEGDDMTFIDGESKPSINGTGTEDYFCGAWDFFSSGGGRPFANLYNGAPYIQAAEVTGGRYCLYRWNADNPIAFTKSLRHTIEHGHANDRGDSFCSVAYWYQAEPSADFPALPPLPDRLIGVRR